MTSKQPHSPNSEQQFFTSEQKTVLFLAAISAIIGIALPVGLWQISYSKNVIILDFVIYALIWAGSSGLVFILLRETLERFLEMGGGNSSR